MGRPLHISQTETMEQAKSIFQIVQYGESGIGMCYPGCKIDYNLRSFLDMPAVLRTFLGKYYKKYALMLIICDQTTTLSSFIQELQKIAEKYGVHKPKNDIAEICVQLLDRGFDPYFFVTNVHAVSKKQIRDILFQLNQAILLHARVGAQIFIEQNVFCSPWNLLFQQAHKLSQNVRYFPVYSYTESVNFVKTLGKEWDMKLSQQVIRDIVTMCGGYLWMLREAVRLFRDGVVHKAQDLVTQDGIQMRARTIIDLFSQQELFAIVAACSGDTNGVSKEVLSYLENLGVIEKKRNVFSMSSQILYAAIQEKISRRRVAVHEEKVLVDGTDCSVAFQKNEVAVLRLLTKKPHMVVTREEIAHCFWKRGASRAYSDWAFDQKMSRLRKSLQACGVSRSYIQTKKGLGFFIQ